MPVLSKQYHTAVLQYFLHLLYITINKTTATHITRKRLYLFYFSDKIYKNSQPQLQYISEQVPSLMHYDNIFLRDGFPHVM